MNKYAPLKEQREYFFERSKEIALYTEVYASPEEPNVWKTFNMLPSDPGRTHKYQVITYCPYCKHIEIASERPLACSKCGKRLTYFERYTECHSLPYKANIYEMEDGTYAISLIYVDKCLIPLNKDGKLMGMVKKKSYITRVIISRNGHTYYKFPRVLRDREYNGPQVGGLARGFSNAPVMTDVTYRTFKIVVTDDTLARYTCDKYVGSCLVMDNDTAYALNTLRDNGIIDVEAIKLRNRFRNLSYEYLNKIRNFRISGKFGYIAEQFYPSIQRLIGRIRKDMNDEEMITMLMDTLHIRTKKLRRLFVENPFDVATLLIYFRKLGFKDINNFYKLYDVLKHNYQESLIVQFKQCYERNNDLAVTFFKNYIASCGETAVTNELINRARKHPTLLTDTFDYIRNLNEYYHYTFDQYVSNIHTMHDNAMNLWNDLEKVIYNNRRNANYLNELHAIIANEPNQSKRNALIYSSMQIMAETMNHEITYHPSELELASEYDGIQFLLPKTTDDLIDAGEKLHNCVGRLYRTNAYQKKCTIVLMKHNNKLTGCIEIQGKKIIQAYGPCNQTFRKAEQVAFDHWKQNNPYFTDKNSRQADFSYNYDEYETWYDKYMQNPVSHVSPVPFTDDLPF